MIHGLSFRISKRMAVAAVIPSEQISVCAYGMELVISSAAGIVILILLSVLAKLPFLWAPYLVGFVPLRLTGGGYHAKTHLGCLGIFSAVYGLALLLVQVIHFVWWLPALCAGIAFIVVLFLSPVQAVNKPLKEQVRRKNRQRSIDICLINLAVPILCKNVSQPVSRWFLMYYMGYSAAILSMVTAVVIQKRKGGEK